MQNTPWYQDKNFWANVTTIAILLASLIRGVPVSPAVQGQLNTTEQHAAVAAERTAETGEKVDKVQKQTRAVAAKVGAHAAE